MSLFFRFYLADNKKDNFEALKKEVVDCIPPLSEEYLKSGTQIAENSTKKLDITCNYFWLRIENGGEGVDFRTEDYTYAFYYEFQFQYEFLFDIYRSDLNWYNELVIFVGKIMTKFSGDCVLEFNGDTPRIMRFNDKIVLASDVEEEQANAFESVGLSFVRRDLPVV